MPLFDAYIFVDWSAAQGPKPKKPTADAVWSAESVPELNHGKEMYHRTRRGGVEHVQAVLLEQIEKKRRVLVGFDFPYGYPAGFANALGLPTVPQSWWNIWTELATRMEDTENNKNNRFTVASKLNMIAGKGKAGPFWGCPPKAKDEHEYLRPRSPGFPFSAAGGVRIEKLRLAEKRLPGTQEAWGLFGPGRVGGQALVGIPYIFGLRRHPKLVWASRAWPFETGFTPLPEEKKGPFILHAEIWPSVVNKRVQKLLAEKPNLIRDEAQVKAMCQWAAELDRQNKLGAYFDRPKGLTDEEIQVCVEQEGWILGAR